MPSRPRRGATYDFQMTRPASIALVACSLGLCACGSKAKSTSVGSTSSPQPIAASAPTTSTATSGQTPASPATSGGTKASTTHTATEPAFTSQPSSSEASSSAAAIVRAHGFTPVNTSDYHPSQTLRVLVGTRTGSGDGYIQSAFFFVDGRYIGTDSSAPSAALKVVSQSDTEVTLAYTLYRPADALCCARGGEAHVRFQLNNGKLVALDPIPPVGSSRGGEFEGKGRR